MLINFWCVASGHGISACHSVRMLTCTRAGASDKVENDTEREWDRKIKNTRQNGTTKREEGEEKRWGMIISDRLFITRRRRALQHYEGERSPLCRSEQTCKPQASLTDLVGCWQSIIKQGLANWNWYRSGQLIIKEKKVSSLCVNQSLNCS